MRVRIAIALALTVLALPALSGCGLKGRLDRPPPLFGNPPDEGPNDPRHVKERRDAAAANKAEKKKEQADEAVQRNAEAQKELETQQPTNATSSPPAPNPAPAPGTNSPIPNQR